MREELHLARMVQEAALHDKTEAPFVRKAVIYQPYSEVSGDVYDFSLTAGAAFNAFLGDATGHGVGAAIMTMMVQVALDSIGPDAPIDELLGRLHRLILERTGDQYVTGCYARIAPDGELTYSSAGHPPLAFVPRQHGAVLLNGLGGLPLGLLEASTPCEVGRQRLEPGDRVYLYTDGLVEWADAAEEQFGGARLLKSLSRGRSLELKESVALVLGDVRAFAGEAPCPDDLTLIGLEFDPAQESA